MFFCNYHLVGQQILPQNIWCLSLTRRFCPSHMMWHNLWPQTQNISADVNTFSFHVLNIADQAKFHFTEKTTFFPDCGKEKLVRVQTWYLCLCPFRLQPLQFSAENFPTSQGSKAEKCEFVVGVQTPREFLISLPPLLWPHLARERSAKRGTPGKSCKSETRNLYKHCAELKYWISRCHAHPR